MHRKKIPALQKTARKKSFKESHRVKKLEQELETKTVTTVKEARIPGLNQRTEFDEFFSPFIPYFFVSIEKI